MAIRLRLSKLLTLCVILIAFYQFLNLYSRAHTTGSTGGVMQIPPVANNPKNYRKKTDHLAQDVHNDHKAYDRRDDQRGPDGQRGSLEIHRKQKLNNSANSVLKPVFPSNNNETSLVRGEVIQSVRRVHPISYDIDTIPRLLTCQRPAPRVVDYSTLNSSKLTRESCTEYCVGKGNVFLALANGRDCHCLNQHGADWLAHDQECNVTCSGNPSQLCGGANDGGHGWSVWMSFGWERTTSKKLRTRYRGCIKEGGNEAYNCTVEVQQHRDMSEFTAGLEWIRSHFIGCFTHQTWNDNQRFDVIHSEMEANHQNPAIMRKCLDMCSQTKSTLYAVVLMERCVCSNSLGWSRPTDTCIFKSGALVFSSRPIKSSHLVQLNFEGRRTRKKIAVVAHYRGGSTFTSLMFSSYPGAMYVFEPASVFGVRWEGVNMTLSREEQRSRTFLNRIYPLWFNCKMSELPGNWLTRYPMFGVENSGFEGFRICKASVGTKYAPILCAALLEEKCLMAPIIAAKTTRMINSKTLQEFITSAPDIDFIHSFRDIRGTLASRARLERYYKTNQVKHLEIACEELNNLYPIFEGVNRLPNTHHIHYEDLAREAVNITTSIYRELGLSVPGEVLYSILVATGYGEMKRKNNFDTVQDNPSSRILSWIKQLNHKTVEQAEKTKSCTTFFSTYKNHYKPIQDLLKDSKS